MQKAHLAQVAKKQHFMHRNAMVERRMSMKVNKRNKKGFGLYETAAVLTFVVLTALYFAPFFA
jgi:MFS-type transporter involved in bile tolerance (Atg22 family)